MRAVLEKKNFSIRRKTFHDGIDFLLAFKEIKRAFKP